MSTELPEPFDPETQEGNSWDLLPVGEYTAQVVEVDVKPTKSGNGYYLALTWRIVEGDYENRPVWQRINYLNSSETAQTIGRKQMKDLCVALDVNEHLTNAEVFLFKPARIKVGIERDKDGVYDDKNVVKRVLPFDPPVAPVAAKPTSSTKPAAPAKSAAKPTAARPSGSAPWHQG